jgi:endonuclease YncB( thermonuclease family)
MATRWKSMGRASACGESTRQRATGSAAVTTVFIIAAAREQRTSLLQWSTAICICQPVSLDRYGRTVASCPVNGTDVAKWLVRQGLALDWARYSHGRYAKAESDARRHEREIRAGSYVQPSQFRDCVKRGGSPGRVFREIGVRNVATSKVDSKVKNICKGC